jgi:hypothetical protein
MVEYHFLFADIPGTVRQFNIRKEVKIRGRGLSTISLKQIGGEESEKIDEVF